MNLLSIILLLAPPADGKGGGFGGGGFIFILLIFVVMYFFMIRPQMKKQKEQKKFREAIKKGDKVVTIGGLHGRILEVDDKTVLIEADSNVKLRFDKSAVASNTDDTKK